MHWDILDKKRKEILDVGCMKLSTIVSRSLEKDYIDLYFILKTISLEELLNCFIVKYPSMDKNLILKSLIYFDDVEQEKIIFKEGNFISLEEVKIYLQKIVKEYFK